MGATLQLLSALELFGEKTDKLMSGLFYVSYGYRENELMKWLR